MNTFSSRVDLKLSNPADLIKKSFKIFFKKENFIYFLKIYVVLIPFTVFPLLLNLFFPSRGELSDYGSQIALFYQRFGVIPVVGVTMFVIVVAVTSLIISFWVSATGIKAVSEIVKGNQISVSATFRYAWQKLWGLFLVNFLSGLIAFGGLIATFTIWGLLAIFYPTSTNLSVGSAQIIISVIRILLVVGALVSFVFVFIFVVWLAFSRFVYIDQELGVKASLRTSRELVKGRFWKVLGRLFVFMLFVMISRIIFSLVPYGIGGVIFTISGGLFLLPYFLLYRELGSEGNI